MPIADPSLPISAQLKAISKALEQHHQLVLEAPPGAGKTTSVPLALMDASWRRGRKILMLEPRRIAARAAAARMAELLGEPIGQSVGYTIRLEKRVSVSTVVEVVTEGILTRRLQQDPELADTALVIFDEFHERNIHSDLGLALCLQARELFRDEDNPLKLLVMSATLDGAAVCRLLDSPVIHSEGRCYPVDIHYGRTQPLVADITHELVTTVINALSTRYRSIVATYWYSCLVNEKFAIAPPACGRSSVKQLPCVHCMAEFHCMNNNRPLLQSMASASSVR